MIPVDGYLLADVNGLSDGFVVQDGESEIKFGDTVLKVDEGTYYCVDCYEEDVITVYSCDGEELGTGDEVYEVSFSPYRCCKCDESLTDEAFKIDDEFYCQYHAYQKLGWEFDFSYGVSVYVKDGKVIDHMDSTPLEEHSVDLFGDDHD